MGADMIITNMESIKFKHQSEHILYEYTKYEVTPATQKYEVDGALQGYQTVAAFYEIAPGKSNYPYHYHTTNEEVFYVISGHGELKTPMGTQKIKAGDIIICPAGESSAHQLFNTSITEPLCYLDVDTNRTPDIEFYPNSGKVGLRLAGGNRNNYKIDSSVEYYEGE